MVTIDMGYLLGFSSVPPGHIPFRQGDTGEPGMHRDVRAG